MSTVRIVSIILIIVAIIAICIIRGRNLSKDLGKEKARGRTIRSIAVFMGIIVAVIILFSFVFMLNYIPSASMEPTVMTSDILLSTRFDSKNINRYDIMVFKGTDDPDTYYIKRVIGLPGETIEIKDGYVYADGVLLDSSFVKEKMEDFGEGTYAVPDDCYFMMGDNRNNSADSRFWDEKYVPLENFEAKAMCTIFPFSDTSWLRQ